MSDTYGNVLVDQAMDVMTGCQPTEMVLLMLAALDQSDCSRANYEILRGHIERVFGPLPARCTFCDAVPCACRESDIEARREGDKRAAQGAAYEDHCERVGDEARGL